MNICGHYNVIFGYITFKKLNVIINPEVIYDPEEWILYTSVEKIIQIHEKCLLIHYQDYKNFKFLSEQELLNQIAESLNISPIKQNINNENPYYFCLKKKLGYQLEHSIYIDNYQVPTYLFEQINKSKSKNDQKNLFILSYFYHHFRKTGCKYLGYYFELIKLSNQTI